MALKKAPKQKLLCPQGKTFTKSIRITDKFKNLADLTGYTARIEIRSVLPTLGESTPEDDDVIHVLTTENGGITIDPLIGKVSLFISDEDTASFPIQSYIWELELTSSTGNKPYLMSPSAFQVLSENTLGGV